MVKTDNLTPTIARNILRDLYAPCIDSLLSWHHCAEYTTCADLSDADALVYLEYILAGYSLTVSEAKDGIFHPAIAP